MPMLSQLQIQNGRRLKLRWRLHVRRHLPLLSISGRC
jgi:hypothetical protein